MKTLYLDCGMGAAGDMLMAALLELHPDPAGVIARLNALGIPGVEISMTAAEKCGIQGTHAVVTVNGQEELSADVHDHAEAHEHTHEHHHDHEEHEHHHDHDHEHEHTHEHEHEHDHGHSHHHAHPADIYALIRSLELPDAVKEHALAVYGLIAEAEGAAHGKPVEEIHFHEVGTMDAVADVVGCSLLFHELGAEKIVASPVHVGSGHVHCAHGILPVPAPATAYILRDVPIYSTEIEGELCTPTGAALLKHFVTEFGSMPVMKVEKIGYGMGNKDFARANLVRAMLGETAESPETVLELQCNLDDMTAEDIGFAMDQLLKAGALDVWTAPIMMKKCRPATLLSCLVKPADREKFTRLLFLHTTTLGVRASEHQRSTLTRRTETVNTAYGDVTVKYAEGFGVSRAKPEYDDLAKLAEETGKSIAEIRRTL